MHLVSARAGSTHLRYATPWQARWHVTAPSTFAKATADKPLRFGTGLASPEQSGGGRLERAQARQPTVTEADVRPRRHDAALDPSLDDSDRLRSIKSVYIQYRALFYNILGEMILLS